MPSAEEHELTENATRAMMTRVASPEEIEYLKQAEGQKTRRRIVLTVGLIVPLLIILAILLPKPKPPETVLEWPRDAKGEFLDAFEPAPSGGVKDGGYAILYPGNPGAKVTQVPGGVIIETRIGRKLNVPLRVILKEDENPHYVELTRDQMVAEWKDEVSREEGRWSIGLPYATVYFIGGENGIPYKRVAYQRDDGQQWFGLASILRTGKKRIVLRAEVPVGEEARAENLLWDINLDPATAFERAAWEGGPAAARVDAPAVLRDVRVELDRMAPATWSSIEALLVSVLAQSVREGKTEQEQEAVALLARLRERQALWFNAQRIAREDALAQGDQARAQRIADLCKAVFSNIEDQRYYSVRKW